MTTSIKGVAGEDIPKQLVIVRRGSDGKYYRAAPFPDAGPPAGMAGEAIGKGQLIEWRDGLWRPVVA